VRAIIEPALEAAGIRWREGPGSNDVQRQRVVVSQGVGVALVPRSAMPVGTAPVEFFELRDPLWREAALMWRRDLRQSSSIRAFLDVARYQLRSYGRPEMP
jgi:DNA-binding transcriptional LysR family regulator